ncbi:MAG: DUF1559 domain-containing protein, partial [Planctomycetales bacterium]|nr:DUF1559 domain-containing protein [Planctomycetales bacterium]
RLAAEPALRRELEQIRACLQSAEPEDCGGCPEGLADRTAEGISRLSDCGQRAVEPSGFSSRWSLVDVCVAAGVVLALGSMLLPAIPRSREASRRLACQDNMRQLGQALVGYSQEHDGYFPYIQPNENAGMFAVRLAESGQLSKQDLRRLLLCRAASLRDGSSRITVVVPNASQLEHAKGQALEVLRRWMAGSYAYRLGYVQNRQYHGIVNHENSRSPILSDSPTRIGGQWVSTNHGVREGQNVLYQDGGVRFQVGSTCPSMDANLFVNHYGLPAAGDGPSDVVLVRSDLTPGVGPQVKAVIPAVFRTRTVTLAK